MEFKQKLHWLHKRFLFVFELSWSGHSTNGRKCIAGTQVVTWAALFESFWENVADQMPLSQNLGKKNPKLLLPYSKLYPFQ